MPPPLANSLAVHLATALCRGQLGLAAPLIEVQVHLAPGLPTFHIVGLPATAVRESKERVRAALENCGFEFPAGRITVSLAPADLPKDGGRYDLPIAIGILQASAQLRTGAEFGAPCELYGELGLGGELRPVRGLLPAAAEASRARHQILIPAANRGEALLVARAVDVHALTHLREVCALLGAARTRAGASPGTIAGSDAAASCSAPLPGDAFLDVADVRGQHLGKRALLVAAAGGHSMLLHGPPGAGKSMLAQRLPGLLPPLTHAEALEVAMVASASAAGFDPRSFGRRPFRAPHHTASAHAIVGGGPHARPGEVSLAHKGVLFLDELPEFDRRVLEALRQPLESGNVAISRARVQALYPAAFQLIAAMNPCPCGESAETGACRCTPAQIRAYRGRLSAPLLDRIDLHVSLARVAARDITAGARSAPDSAQLAALVRCTRERQLARRGKLNHELTPSELHLHAPLAHAAARLLEQAFEQLQLTARSYHRLLRVARTLADLDGSDAVELAHVAEAVQLRREP